MRSMTDRVHQVQLGDRKTVLETTLHRLRTRDGVDISLSRLEKANAKASVLLVHGLTTSSDMFLMPEHYNLTAYLHDHGYDVWVADFRMSNHYAYNTRSAYNFDDIAAFDYPSIVECIRGHIRDRPLHAICHCLGSVTFHASLYGRQITGIQSVISNSVSLTPRVTAWQVVKLLVAPYVVEKLLGLRFLDPAWGLAKRRSTPWIGRALAKLVGYVHLECQSEVCNLLSFVWGNGSPGLFVHANMARTTHERLAGLFGPVAMPYFRHVRKCVLSDETLVRYGDDLALPQRYLDNVGEVQVPTLLVSGSENHVFPGSNRLTAERIAAKRVPGYWYREIRGYGHQDVFMGKNCAEDVFPIFLEHLEKHTP